MMMVCLGHRIQMAAGTASTEGWSSSSQDSVALGDKPAAVADKLVVWRTTRGDIYPPESDKKVQ